MLFSCELKVNLLSTTASDVLQTGLYVASLKCILYIPLIEGKLQRILRVYGAITAYNPLIPGVFLCFKISSSRQVKFYEM